MGRVRPGATFPDLSDSFGNISFNKEGRMVLAPEHPRRQITSLKLANYRTFMTRMTIQ